MFLLDKLHRDDDFTDTEQDVKILITSLLGILNKTFGKSQREKTKGLQLMEDARKMGEEYKLIYERTKWLQYSPDILKMEVTGENRPVIERINADIMNKIDEIQ